MRREVLVPAGWSVPLSMYSPGIKVGDAIHVAGIVGRDDAGNLVGLGDCGAQTRQVLQTIQKILAAGGASLADVAITEVILKDMSDWPAMNEVWAEFFPKDPPARYSYEANLAKPEFLVEIVATAYVGSGA